MKTWMEYLDEEFVTLAPDADKTPIYAPDCYQLAVHAQRLKEVVQRYATAAIKEHLSRAAENARAIEVDKDYNFQPGYYPIHAVDRESITNIDIVLP